MIEYYRSIGSACSTKGVDRHLDVHALCMDDGSLELLRVEQRGQLSLCSMAPWVDHTIDRVGFLEEGRCPSCSGVGSPVNKPSALRNENYHVQSSDVMHESTYDVCPCRGSRPLSPRKQPQC